VEDGVEDEAFTLKLACEMIGETPQKDGNNLSTPTN
jgi:hypothetical protein